MKSESRLLLDGRVERGILVEELSTWASRRLRSARAGQCCRRRSRSLSQACDDFTSRPRAASLGVSKPLDRFD